MKILMVCLGNICRSPLAEGIMQAKLPEGFQVDSAGTSDFHEGSAPDYRSVVAAKRHRIDITAQKSRPIRKEDLDNFDLILCMDRDNYRAVSALAQDESQRSKIHLILESEGQTNGEVPDPYYGGAEGFEKVYQMLDAACDHWAAKLTNP